MEFEIADFNGEREKDRLEGESELRDRGREIKRERDGGKREKREIEEGTRASNIYI